MKDSGVAWIGEIPDTWDVAKIKHYFNISSGTTPKSENEDFWDGDIVWITPADYKTDDIYVSNGHRNLSKVGYLSSGLILYPPNTIIFSKRAPIGQVVLSAVPLCINQGCLAAVAKDSADPSYFRYVMSSSTEEFEQAGSGTTFKEISAHSFGNIVVPLPPTVEQKRIVHYLDQRCSQIDKLINNQHAIIVKLKEFKQSLITEVVTKGLNPHIRFKDSGVEWLGFVPEHWSINRIGNVYADTSEPGNESLPILSVSINSGVSDKELSDEESDRVFVRSDDRSKYKRVRPGDLTYNMMRAWQGAFGAVRVDGMVSPAYIVARPKAKGIDTRYIEALMRTPLATEEMHRYSHGIADFRLRLYWPEFKNIKICLPDLSEQQQIADYIDMKSVEIDSSIAKRETLIAKLAEYKKSLIYEVVTGKKEV